MDCRLSRLRVDLQSCCKSRVVVSRRPDDLPISLPDCCDGDAKSHLLCAPGLSHIFFLSLSPFLYIQCMSARPVGPRNGVAACHGRDCRAMMCFSLHLRSEQRARVAQAAPGFVSCSSTRTMAIPRIPPPAGHSNVCNNRPQEGHLQVSSPPPGEEMDGDEPLYPRPQTRSISPSCCGYARPNFRHLPSQ